MFTNAADAVEGLRHKRTGAILPTKNIANNTTLIHYCDELVGLRFHQTVIATYHEDGVRIDTRDADAPNGWMTATTMARIDEFTPARVSRSNNVFSINDRLYRHGAILSPEGEFLNPLDDIAEQVILERLHETPRLIASYARQMLKLWKAFTPPPQCCIAARGSEEGVAHIYRHVVERRPAVLPSLPAFARGQRNRGVIGGALERAVETEIRTGLRKELLPYAVRDIAPPSDFPYPQIVT